MGNLCKLTGIDLSVDGATNGIKPMCLNCTECQANDNEFVCINDSVMEKNKQRVMESIPEGIEVENITLKPLKLKNPTKKCGFYRFDKEAVMEYLSQIMK